MARLYSSSTRREEKSDAERLQEKLKEEEELARKHGATAAAVEKVKKGTVGAVEKVVDVLSRPNYAIVGGTEEVLNRAPTTDVLKRAGTELFSGIGGLQGQKRTFKDVLADRGMGGKAGWTLGLGLDIATDPTTWTTFGVGAAAKAARIERGAKQIALSAKGRKLAVELAKKERPRLVRITERYVARHPNADPVKVMSDMDRAHFMADEIAYSRARTKVAEMIAQGAPGLVDQGGVKFMGKTVIAGERISAPFRPVGAKMTAAIKRFEATGPGARIIEHGRAVDTAMDRVFHETLRKGRHLPGYDAVVASWRNGKRAAMNRLVTFLGERTGGWDKVKVPHASGEIALKDYVTLARDNPELYPLSAIPEAAQQDAKLLFEALDVWGTREIQQGMLHPESFRQNYVPHYFRNSPAQMKELTQEFTRQFPVRSRQLQSIGGAAEERTFQTIQEALDFHAKLKAAGIVKWDLKPITDIREIMFRRGRVHYSAEAAEEMFGKIKNLYGLDKTKARKEWLARSFPKVSAALGDQADNPQVAKVLGIMDDLSSAESPEEYLKRFFGYRRAMGKLDPNLVGKIREIEAGERLSWMAAFDDPVTPFRRPGSALDGHWIPKSIADDIAHKEKLLPQLDEFGPMIAGLDWMQHHFKTGMTVLWPAFHFRNFYNNVAQNFVDLGLGAFDPTNFREYTNILRGADGTIQTPLRRYTNEEFRALAKQHNIIGGKTDFNEVLREKLGKKYGAIELGRKIGGKVEDFSKLQLFHQHLKRGLSPDEAAARVRQFLFDYDELSPIERKWMRRIFPFYTWQRKNVSLVARQIGQRPGRYLAMQKAFDRSRGPEEDALPAYIRGDLKVKLQRKGKRTYLTGLDLPFNSAVETLFGLEGMGVLRRFWSQTTPVLRGIGELAANQEAFTGQPITGAPPDDVGPVLGKVLSVSPLKDYFEYHEEVDKRTGKPLYLANRAKVYILFKSWAMGRAFGYARKVKPDDLDKWALDFLTGIKFKEFDLTDVEERRLQEQLRRMEKDLVHRGLLREGTYKYEATK